MASLLLFASLKEKLGTDALTIDPGLNTIAEVREWLIEQHPEVSADLEQVIWAKNEEYAELSETFSSDDTLAIISPVSGG
ncbi:MoaD/ThiS family protein [Alkalihalobacillus oceani]|uniref:MoaD/ThiS family protein n=1 Tax=Halalkalibacter oceani TaxID=1653776 RepID=UPI00203B4BD8|nr:MoaD/ThiS family protein [Halalkalibacter oceani]MCM3760265.1 MoaD/ThiS family protein [Halalkalibacter oceani]